MEIKDIEVVAYLLVEKRFGQEFNRLFFAEGIEKRNLQPEIGDTALYTTEQMQEYAKSKVREALERVDYDMDLLTDSDLYFSGIINELFTEVQDES